MIHGNENGRKPAEQNVSVGEQILAGLQEFAESLQGELGDSRLVARRFLIPDPGEFGPQEIKNLLVALDTTPALFARVLGCSERLVRAWMSGSKSPSPMARRLLDEIDLNSERWRDDLQAKPVPRQSPDRNGLGPKVSHARSTPVGF